MRSFSEALAREFYVDFLGFEVMFEHRHSADAPLYLSLQLDGCTLHLTEHFGDAAPGAAVRIPVADVDALCEALRAKNYPQAHPTVSVKPWGAREMSIADPFGNRLTFATEES
ncbi:MAG: glyoxalase superfamily protein [Myxococcota bacterium]